MNVIEIRFKVLDCLSIVTVSSESLTEYKSLLSFYQNDDRIDEIAVRNLRNMHQEVVYRREANNKWSREAR